MIEKRTMVRGRDMRLQSRAPSLRIQEKLGFVRDSEAMLFANPAGKEMSHVATSITRARFAELPR
jgi:hypothetical protein